MSLGQQSKHSKEKVNCRSSNPARAPQSEIPLLSNEDGDAEVKSPESSSPNLDASVATVEEFIPDIPESHSAPSVHLNFLDPTIQLM